MSRVLPSASLQNQQGGSDKVYNCEIISADADQYLVNFSYGRRGSTLKAGTKTATPVDYDAALSAFEKLVKSKQKKGYVSSGDPVQGGVALSTDTVGFFPQLLNPITPEDVGSALCTFGDGFIIRGHVTVMSLLGQRLRLCRFGRRFSLVSR